MNRENYIERVIKVHTQTDKDAFFEFSCLSLIDLMETLNSEEKQNPKHLKFIKKDVSTIILLINSLIDRSGDLRGYKPFEMLEDSERIYLRNAYLE